MTTAAQTPDLAPDTCDVAHPDGADLPTLRATLLSERAVTELAETFRALGDATRVRMLDALSHGERCVCDLAAALGLTESAVSHQLRLLRHMRLVRTRRSGRLVFYALDDHHIMSLFQQARRHVQELTIARSGGLAHASPASGGQR